MRGTTKCQIAGLSALFAACAALAFACGDDGDGDDAPADGGAGDIGGSTAGGGTGGTNASGAGNASGGSGGGQPNGGMMSSGGMTGGTEASTADGGSPSTAGSDAGSDPGSPPAGTVCKAPVPNDNAGNECPVDGPVPLQASLVTDELEVPVFVTAAPDDDTRLFVLERHGVIQILDPTTGEMNATPFLDIDSKVVGNVNTGPNDERGLLGLAFHPDYPQDPRFFVNYINMSGVGARTVISSFTVSADPDVANADSEVELFEVTQPAGNHNGGMLAFGPDGCLYAGTGDGGGSDDTYEHGQDPDSTLAKMLRFDVDDPKTGAPGNLDSLNIPHAWSWGLRNPWRFSFDRETGDLYIGDVGQNTREEVDVEARGKGGKNYGWPDMEGINGTNNGNFTLPVHDYQHANGNDCVVGGYVYRGGKIPSLQGFYVFGDNGPGPNEMPGRKVWAFVWDGDGMCQPMPVDLGDDLALPWLDEITSFGEDALGELYITTISGKLFRIDPE